MILFFILLASTSAVLTNKPYYELNNAHNLFKEFIQEHGKEYDPEEYLKRLEIFKESLKEINELNVKHPRAQFGVNRFADMTTEERQRYFGLKPIDDSFHKTTVMSEIPKGKYKELPNKFDWRDRNVVTPVKDQGGCGSCWIFSATGNIESQYAIKHNKTVILSEQQSLDCTQPYDHKSNCNGGFPHKIMYYGIGSGIDSGEDYKYVGKPAICIEELFKPVAKVDTVSFYRPANDTELMQLLVETGPLSVGLQGFDLIFYRGGIILAFWECGGPINHAALLVGYYAERTSTPYYILKNSWGDKWGENGYFLMEFSACQMGTSYTATCTVT